MSTPEKVMTPCPSCGAKLAVPSTAAGKKIRCPKCQTVVAITAEMVTPPPDNMTSPAEVLKAVPRPEVSLSDENTFAGAKQKKYAPESLGHEATFGGVRGVADDHFTDDMEIVDLAGRYKVEGVLGKGGMGEVQLATDTRLNRKVAIKRMLGDAAKSRTAVSRFLIEAKSIAALNHPNIVQIYDYGRDKDGPFLILEYVDGQSLLDKCHSGALSLELAVDLSCQLCDGLGKAHDSGIIHRDIKPANVLMTKDGVPKLTDFGLAKDEASDSGLSVAGAVLGTLDFMPPEQRKDVSLTDSRSDLWSLAATLYQMVTGKSPKVIRLNDLPASLQSVLGKALEDKPNDRYQSATEFRNALREAIDESRATLTNLTEGQCPSCGTKNEANRKFCRKCAVSLEVKCLSCSKGMPVWDEICGSCGTKQSPLIASKKEQLQQRQHQAEGFLQEGKFREATQIAEELQSDADPRFQHLKKWSAEFIEGVKREQQQQQQRSRVLHKEAKTHQAAHDYSSAIHALEQIPASLRTPDISALLMQVQGQEERTKELNDEIRLRVERRELDGLIARVDELLQLVPDRVDLRDLRDTLEKRDQQRLAARSSASLEANRLMDARKYAECVAALQSIKGSLRTPEIEALQKDAASKQSRLEKLQKTIDQSVKNNQLQGLLTKLDELLLLKSDATEGDRQLREQLVAREQKQKSQIKALLQKVHQLRKEVRFDEAMELLRRVPEELQNEAISTAIDDLQFFADQRSGAIAGLTQATNERQIKEALANADEYRGMLTSEIIADKAFESAMKECRQRLEDLRQAQEFSIRRRQRQKKLIIVGSVVSLLLLVAVAGFVIQRQQRLTAIADAQQRGDAAMEAADFTTAIVAYDEVVQLDDTVADAWAGLAFAKLQQTPPDVTSAFGDLEKSAALSPDGEKLQQARRLAHARRAIERANAGSVTEALQDVADAEKLAASADEIAAAKSAIASAYLKRAEEAVAAKQPEAALKELQEARTNNPQSDQLPRVSQMIAEAYLDRADASVQQSAIEPALAAIESARAIQAELPRIPELQAAALVIRAQQALQAGDRNKASADFLAAKNLSFKATGLGSLAASLADGLVQRCEEAFSDASFQEATATLQTVAEIDGTSATLLALKERLGKVLVSEFDNAIQAKESDHAIELTKSFSALQVPADERLRLTTAVAAILFQECQNEIAAEELTSAIDAFSKLQKLPVSDVSMRKQANDTLLPGMQTLILAGLKSPDFAPAVNALKEVVTLGQVNEAFDGQVRDSVQTLQDSELSPIITEVLLQSRLSRGLIAYYKLDGNAEDVTTYSGEGIVNGATSTSGRHGNANAAYAFDGKYLVPGSKTIVLPACGPLGKSPRTFSVWAKTATRETQLLLEYGDAAEGDATSLPGSAFQLTLSYESYGMTASTGRSAITYQADYADNQWHHFVWIVPDTAIPTTADIQLFLDGTLVSVDSGRTHVLRSDLAVATSKSKIGLGIVVGQQFTGELDDIRIYDRALTSEDVADLFKVEKPADVSRGLAMPGIAVAPFDEAQAEAHQKAWADYLGVPDESTNSIGMKLVVIPPGEFMMGSPESEPGRQPDETQHRVTLPQPFQMTMHEVTQRQYEQVMGSNPSRFKGVDNPVEQVSWGDAVAFVAKLSAIPAEQTAGRIYRLPTEAEWEYACRAGTTTVYSFGDDAKDLSKYAWFGDNSGKSIIDSASMYPTGSSADYAGYFAKLAANHCETHAVGEKLPNGWGLYDMHGNVFEWCSDVNGSLRVRRGGGWGYGATHSRTALRGNAPPTYRDKDGGFRVVCDIPRLNAAVSEIGKALPASLSEGLVAYYPFDGNAKDQSGNGNDGDVKGATLIADRKDRADAAYVFDGKLSRIDLPETLFASDVDAASITAWIAPAETANNDKTSVQQIISKGAETGEMTLNLSDGFVCFSVNFKDPGGWHTVRAPIPPNGTFFVAGVYEKGKRLRIWINDNLSDEAAIPNVNLHQTRGVLTSIGAYRTSSAARDLFHGIIDDIRIYNRALSLAEVKALYDYESSLPITTVQTPAPAIAPFDTAQAKVYQKAWADHLGVPVETTNAVGMKLVLIPPGEFMMGSPESEREPRPDETLHPVTLTHAFQLGAHEVTQLQYEKVIGANPSNFKGPDNPVEQITWDAAAEFCRQLSALPAEKAAGHVYRLPTEAEWEYSCRAGSTTSYGFGNDISQLADFAWAKVNSGGKPQPVGQKKPNAWGLFDMHGNVWEWCHDWQGDPPRGAATDPQGPSVGTNRADRGGCWSDTPEYLRAAIRGYVLPNERGSSLGFRVVCEIKSFPAPAITPFDTTKAKAQQKAWADHLGVPVETTNSIGMKLVLIPPGEFVMGSPETEPGRNPDETQHKVTLTQPFQIGIYEVTQEQYEKAVGANPSTFKAPNNPVEQVSWDEALEFCRRLSAHPEELAAGHVYRLPTEAEWEFACRSGTTTAYSFGNDESPLGKYAWYEKNSGNSTHPVGHHQENVWGLYDTYGNAWEWCFDWHAPYPEAAVTDPQGPKTGLGHVLRGGCFNNSASFVRSAHRMNYGPTAPPNVAGFRIVKDLQRANRINAAIELMKQEANLRTSDKRVDILPGFVAENWASDLGFLSGVTVGPGGSFGTDPYVYQVPKNVVLRVTGRNSVNSFAVGFPTGRHGRIIFDAGEGSGSFGNAMFVSAPQMAGGADLIYRVQENGVASVFYTTSLRLTKGIAFGHNGDFGHSLYAINTSRDSLLSISPSGRANNFGSQILSHFANDDLIITSDSVFGKNAYITDQARGKLLRMPKLGRATDFGNVPNASSIARGEGAFGDFLYVGTADGNVFRVNPVGEAGLFLKEFTTPLDADITGIDFENDQMWLSTDAGVLLRVTPTP